MSLAFRQAASRHASEQKRLGRRRFSAG